MSIFSFNHHPYETPFNSLPRLCKRGVICGLYCAPRHHKCTILPPPAPPPPTHTV